MLRLTNVVLLLLTLMISTADAQRNREFVLLGEKSVGFGVDRDTINIGHNEDWYRTRSFRALHFLAERNDVHMVLIRLVYLNGTAEEVRVDRLIRQNTELPVDLGGDRSYLRQIVMIYRSRPDFRGQAVVKVFGEPARRAVAVVTTPAPAAAAWVELGCQQVQLVGKDRDSVRVGRREGRFKAIRLHVRGGDVEMLDLKVVYANGAPDDLPVKSVIRNGERTRPLDLRGFERSISRVDMVYRNIVNPAQMVIQQRITAANVCVEGLQ